MTSSTRSAPDFRRRLYQLLRSLAGRLGPLHRLFWRLNRFFVGNAPLSSLWKATVERRRLALPFVRLGDLGLKTDAVLVPGMRESDFDEDAYLEDLLFLVQLAKGSEARRILEVGTYRAKTTYAFHLNCPEAFICSYDIRVVDSEYRERLAPLPNIALRLGSFAASGAELRAEALYDLIFIDGSHRLEDVFADSEIAFDIVASGGFIVWHDYRRSGFIAPDLQVPEALHRLAGQHAIRAVKDTNCAVYRRP